MTSTSSVNPGLLLIPGSMVFGLGTMYRWVSRSRPPAGLSSVSAAVSAVTIKSSRIIGRVMQYLGVCLVAAGVVWFVVDIVS